MSNDKDESSQKLPRPEKQLTCGCCSDGCVCENHQDASRGIPTRTCAYHASLPFAPLDRAFRYDSSLGEYGRVPCLPSGGVRVANKCALRGCHYERADGSEFCAGCLITGRAGPRAACDELTAIPDPQCTRRGCRNSRADGSEFCVSPSCAAEPPPSEDACLCGTLLDGNDTDGKCPACQKKSEPCPTASLGLEGIAELDSLQNRKTT